MNTHFSIALHALALLAGAPGRVLTSEALADRIQTNPVFLRRVLGALRTAGVLETRRGAGGGIVLVSDPAAVTLAEIYRLVQGGQPLFPLHTVPVPGSLARSLQGHFADAEAQLIRHLERYTIRDVIADASLPRLPAS